MMGTGNIGTGQPDRPAVVAALELLVALAEPERFTAMLEAIRGAQAEADATIAEAKAAGEEASRQMIEADKAAAAARDERIKADGVIADALGKQAALAEREIALDNRETSLASRERLQIEAAEKADESMRIREQMVEQASKTVAARAEALQAKEAEIDGMRQDLAARLERIRQAAGG